MCAEQTLSEQAIYVDGWPLKEPEAEPFRAMAQVKKNEAVVVLPKSLTGGKSIMLHMTLGEWDEQWPAT